jgi:HD-like signal output (HDOD) protein
MRAHITDRLKQIEFLPMFPQIAGDMMDLLADPKSSASDLVRHMDPSLVGEVLKVANGAYLGRKNFRGIGTVEQAVAAIGYTGLSSLVLQMPFLSMVGEGDILFDRHGFMRHSLSCAILARTMSSILHMGSPSTVYVSGMLHDIGIIVIYQYFKEEFDRINTLMERKGLSRLAAEKEVLSTDHADVGSLLLEMWGIPAPILEAVRLHHTPGEIGEKEDSYVTWLANGLAKQIDFDADLSDFQSFFEKQREILQSEMPERYLLKHHVELFEAAFDQLRRIDPTPKVTPPTSDQTPPFEPILGQTPRRDV